MDGIISGVIVGAVLIGLNIIKDIIDKRQAKNQIAREDVSGYGRRIGTLERHSSETHELAKCTLGMCIILGDGMVQSGINGDVKKAFREKKQDALKML